MQRHVSTFDHAAFGGRAVGFAGAWSKRCSGRSQRSMLRSQDSRDPFGRPLHRSHGHRSAASAGPLGSLASRTEEQRLPIEGDRLNLDFARYFHCTASDVSSSAVEKKGGIRGKLLARCPGARPREDEPAIVRDDNSAELVFATRAVQLIV